MLFIVRLAPSTVNVFRDGAKNDSKAVCLGRFISRVHIHRMKRQYLERIYETVFAVHENRSFVWAHIDIHTL